MTTASLLTLPPGWAPRPGLDLSPVSGPDSGPASGPASGAADGVLAAARGGAPPGSGIAPEVVLHRRSVAADPPDLPGLAAWRARAVAELGRTLAGFSLEDDDVFELEGREVAYHRFVHRGVAADLVSEQWSWLVGDCGLTLTGTVALEDYADLCEVLEDIAGSVEPGALLEAV